ncbi:MAG: 5'-methylthioadenosine/S-adenosylhomocysteine nucleosidase [Candidatus Gracilibacteria bacterium]|nr:5'-methylthioadenosine/S-adenosylhomocysteine nucleosidase [Candidatus Gracilibacteria bacterium]
MEILETKAIITAMKEEAEYIITNFNLQLKKEFKNIKIYEGTREVSGIKENIVLALAGIGKIQAAIATTYIFENYDIIKLVNIGIAGNLKNDDYKIGDVFIPNTFIQHDMYLPFEGEHLDYAKKAIFLDYATDKNYDLVKFGLILNGICLTGDQFIDDAEKVKILGEEYVADIIEMEAFSILSVAREYDALDKCVVIKAISDGADNEAKDAHMNNLDYAMQNSLMVLDLVL